MEIIVLGDGGHSKVIQEMIHATKGHHIIAILDDKYELMFEKNKIIYGPLAYLSDIISAETKVVIAIGNNAIRRQLFKKLLVREDQYLTVIHPSSRISRTATIGNGTVVMPGVSVNAMATVEEHCIINTGAIVEHDTVVGRFAHISPNATLTGNVSIGEGVHIGASTTIIPEIKVGNWAVVGAGSTVIKHIPANSTAVGCPTRIVSKQGKENLEIRL